MKIIVTADDYDFSIGKKFHQFMAENQPIHSIHSDITQDYVRMFF